MLREYFWSLTFIALLLGAYTFLIWQHHSETREPAAALGPVSIQPATLDSETSAPDTP